jgi:hypothetical protein
MRAEALLLLLLLGPAWAIYEDQAGTFDWYKQYVGKPTSVTFLPGKERVFLTAQQSLLASLHTKAGSVAWRRKYTEQDPLDKAVALQKPALLLAASKGGKYVRAWDALDGGFRWEALVFEGSSAVPGATCDIATLDAVEGKGAAVAVVASDTLKVSAGVKDSTGSQDHQLLHTLWLQEVSITLAQELSPRKFCNCFAYLGII